jgi:ribosomal protein L37AE/L43A
MNAATSQLVVVASTMGIGYLMTVSGVFKNALEWRRRRRICPSCGREIHGRTCSSH